LANWTIIVVAASSKVITCWPKVLAIFHILLALVTWVVYCWWHSGSWETPFTSDTAANTQSPDDSEERISLTPESKARKKNRGRKRAKAKAREATHAGGGVSTMLGV